MLMRLFGPKYFEFISINQFQCLKWACLMLFLQAGKVDHRLMISIEWILLMLLDKPIRDKDLISYIKIVTDNELRKQLAILQNHQANSVI